MKVNEMVNLVCLLSKYNDEFKINYILSEDDSYLEHWAALTERYGEEHYTTRPYKEGDVASINGNNIMFGLQILYKYSLNLEFNAEHDQIWAGGKGFTCEEMKAIMSEEDVKKMEQLGWFEDEESWSYFP